MIYITHRRGLVAICLALIGPAQSMADDLEDEIDVVYRQGPRYEVSLGIHAWPGIADLTGANGQSFEEAGFNLGAAFHMPVGRLGKGEIMLGGDLGFASNESDIRLYAGDVSLRDAYLGPSVKWVFRGHNRYSLDAGLLLHWADIAEVTSSYWGYGEIVVWDESAVGGYVGATIDFGAGSDGRRHGLTMAVRIHQADFGAVMGSDPDFLNALGPSPGSLDGPIYALQFGYQWR